MNLEPMFELLVNIVSPSSSTIHSVFAVHHPSTPFHHLLPPPSTLFHRRSLLHHSEVGFFTPPSTIPLRFIVVHSSTIQRSGSSLLHPRFRGHDSLPHPRFSRELNLFPSPDSWPVLQAIDFKDSPLSHLAPSIHPSLYYEIKVSYDLNSKS
ncbi:unnamed protein product [Trifolium pratense]|uniref:Uncharacterized protein n=1 Tax=Trifolium pratense TaxID=57577 RepID=A0ACB0LGZ4_TRIPR|nr:unnamed protein product [Trifolium pratense]